MAENCAARANQLRKGKTIEQIYQKKTQLEHILLRPDTYVGSTEHQLQEMWVFDEAKNQMVHRKIDYVPALYKIFDEILVNAADNAKRDAKMDLIEVTIDRQANCITVLNNGQGIPVQIHKEHKCYVPELIFGHLLTSDNYDDNEKKVTGGRNGYGAKLTNVFSKKFIIETVDKNNKKKFTQIFEKNMTQKHSPVVADCRSDKEYTKVTFWPDFSRFGMTSLDNDICSLMMKRVYDIAASTSKTIKVVLNGKQLPIRSFEDYVRFFLKTASEGSASQCIYERCSERWEVAFSLSDGNFSQVSFVNSINTIKGGTHVAHVSDQVVEAILKVVKGKNRGGIDIKPAHVRNHLWVFINCLIENPAFDSQTKETLTTKQSKFGSTCELSEKIIKQVMKSGIVETILDWVKAKQKVDMSKQLRASKTQGRVSGVPKLDDANDAGGKHSQDCTLILTEGDSAKSLAVAGVSVVGRDKYGVFPLKGKVLNVRDANFKQVTGNAEISNLLQIMGLDLKRQYDSTQGLRYGSIMLMTDQDHDGSHIKGLLINLIHFWWPSLAKMPGFLKEFITPIVKVWKEGKKSDDRQNVKSFFTLPDYQAWKEKTDGGRGWKSKYYKGLGTSTAKEAKEYFSQIERHEVKFHWAGDQDGEAIDLAFNKKRADDRKDWINSYEDGMVVDHTRPIAYTDFINKELVQFAKYDVQRSVPSVVDGFKPSQRKVLFCAFKKRLRHDIKVAQFVGYISEHSAYHHGEVSLENTIVNLAQNFVGSNNTNFLVPSGQFGTRLQGGKDHAASRYIYTRLSPVTRVLFQQDDDHVLNYLEEEGLSIEPQWYCPTLPTVLVNGAEGIGVGWSTSIPNYNPRDIIRNIRKMLRGLPMEDMHPWYKGFMGSIEPSEKEDCRYEVTGVITKTSDTTVEITELPIKAWTQNYKEFLEECMAKDGKKGEESESLIEDFKEHHSESSVHFEITMSAAKLKEAEQAGLEKTFKLKSSLSTSNMVLFDAEGKIAKYNTALDILKEFCRLRRQMYQKRKDYLVAKLTRETEILSNKARFILMVVKGELEIRRKKKADLLSELKKLKFTPMSELDAIMKGKATVDEAAEAESNKDKETPDKTEYDYLLNMNLWSLTYEKVEEIKKQLEVKQEELEKLKATTIEMLWDKDLEVVCAALDELERQEDDELMAAAEATQGRQAVERSKAPAKRTRKAEAEKAPPPRAVAGAAIPPEVVHRRRQAAAEKSKDTFLKKPLSTVDKTEFVQKQVWGANGTGPVKSKKTDTPPAPVGMTAEKAPAAPKRKAAAVQMQPLQDISDLSGASLLSRLLNKSGPTGSSTSSSFDARPLESSDGLFSYLSTEPSTSDMVDLDPVSVDLTGPSSRTADGGASLLSRLLNKSGPTGSSTSSSFDARPLESSDGLFSYLSTEPSTSDMVDLDPVSVDLTGPSSRTADGGEGAPPKRRRRAKTTVVEDD